MLNRCQVLDLFHFFHTVEYAAHSKKSLFKSLGQETTRKWEKNPFFLEKKILKNFFYNYLITLELNFLGLSKAA